MIQAHNISLSFGNQPVFDHLSFIIDQHDRIGLVGRNGSGKTTLLKAIIDPSILEEGSITILNKKKIAYMPQEVVLNSPLSVLDETLTAFEQLRTLQDEAHAIEKQLDHDSNPDLLERYAIIQEQLADFNADSLRADAKKMLTGLGFSLAQLDQPVDILSVGWKMRIVLAKLLLKNADFYLFDEPTNHLDLMAKEWFLDFLKASDFGFIIICHERYFLDELCDKIFELGWGKGTWYSGNYTDYVGQKEHAAALLEAAYAQQQKEIKRKQETIDRFRASASKGTMAKSMEKALEKIERIVLPPSIKNVRFNFPPVVQSGKSVIKVENVSQKFGDKVIFKNVSFEVERGKKIALIAPNGVGKTTLFNVIAGILPVQHGSVTFGYNVTCAIFAQDQNKALDMKKTVIDNIKDLCPKATEQKVRTFLGSFLFSREDVLKKVGVLSGGEKNRVGMVNVLLQNTNLLLLDEPTNHLDIPSKEILLRALQEFEGTLLFVSHDRDFINDLATDIIELTPNGAHYYHGNYASYLYQKKDEIAAARAAAPQDGTRKDAASEQKDEEVARVRQVKQLEGKIAKLEQKIEAMHASFADIEYGTPEFDEADKKLMQLQKELKETERAWEQLQK